MRYGVFAIALIGLACATPGYTPITRYFIDANVDVAKAQPSDKTLGVRALDAERPYKQKIVYRDAGFVLGNHEMIEWAELPRDVVTRALIDALVATGRFKDVGDAVNLAAPDLILTGELRKFDEVRTTDPWTAQCEVRLELREAQGPQALWAGTLSARVPLERNETAALAPAMSRAVAEIVKKAAEQIAAQ